MESTTAQKEKVTSKGQPSPSQVGESGAQSDSVRLTCLETSMSGLQSTLELVLQSLQAKATAQHAPGVPTAVGPTQGQSSGPAPLSAGQPADQHPSNIPLPPTNPLVTEVTPCVTLQPGQASGQVIPEVTDASVTSHGHADVHGPAVQGAGLRIDPTTGAVSAASIHQALACQAVVNNPAIASGDGSSVSHAQGALANTSSVGSTGSNAHPGVSNQGSDDITPMEQDDLPVVNTGAWQAPVTTTVPSGQFSGSVDVHTVYGNHPPQPVNQLQLHPALQAMASVQVPATAGYVYNVPTHPVPLMGMQLGVTGAMAGHVGGYPQATTVMTSSVTTSSVSGTANTVTNFYAGDITALSTASLVGGVMGPPITTPQVVDYPRPSYGSSYGQPIVPPPPGFTPQGYHNPMVSQQGPTTYYPGMNPQAMGGQLPSVQDSLRSLQSAGLLVQDPALAEVDNPTPDYEVGLKFGDITPLDNAIPLSVLQDDIRRRFPDIIASPVTQVAEPSSLGVQAFQTARPSRPVNLPLHPTISQWLERHSLILEGKLSSRGSRPYVGTSTPKAPVLRAARYLPSDTPQLFNSLQVPSGWHRLLSQQSKPAPGALSFSLKEFNDLMLQSQRDLAIVSDLDWLLAGGTSLVNQIAAMTPGTPTFNTAVTLLQRYMQEMSRTAEVLERHSTARYANLNWRIRDGYLNKLHPSVATVTKEQLRRSSLNDDFLFSEDLIDHFAETLKSDVMLATNTQSLKAFSSKGAYQAPRGRGKRGSGQPRPQPPQPKRQRFGRQSQEDTSPSEPRGGGRGGGFRGNRGNRGKGKGKARGRGSTQ